MEVVGIDVAHGAMGIVDDDFRGPGREGAFDRGVDVLGHPFPAVGILRRAGRDLIAVDDPRDALHIDGDIDLQAGFLLVCGQGKADRKHQDQT